MAHSFICCNVHYIFSTKDRRRIVTPELAQRLWPYMGGIAREHEMKALAVGGMEDHIHVLVTLPSTLPVAKAVQLIKGGSSKWVSDTFAEHRKFEWQEGYAAFSVSASRIPETVEYIATQQKHHRKRTFEEEYIEFLDRHGIEYDGRYLWG